MSAPLTLSEVSFSNLLSSSWQVLKKEWPLLFGLVVVVTVVQFILQFVQTEILKSTPDLAIFFGLATWIIMAFVAVGWLHVYIKAARGEQVEPSDFFMKYDRLIHYLLANIVVGVLVTIGYIFLVIPGIILSLKYMFVPYLVIDKELGVGEAMKVSSQMSQGHKWQLLGYMLGFTIVGMTGLIALIVGVFITIPLIMVAYAMLYNAFLERANLSQAAVSPSGDMEI